MSFSGATAAAAQLQGLSNGPLDITPALFVDTSSTERTRCIAVTGHPHVRAVIERRQNTTTAFTVQLLARMGVSANDALDFAPYGPTLAIPAGAVGSVTIYDVTGVCAGDVCVQFVETAASAPPAGTYFRVHLGASAT